jgi:hypothetical protein
VSEESTQEVSKLPRMIAMKKRPPKTRNAPTTRYRQRTALLDADSAVANVEYRECIRIARLEQQRTISETQHNDRNYKGIYRDSKGT